MDKKTSIKIEPTPIYLHPLVHAGAAIAVGAALLFASTQLAASKTLTIQNRTDFTLEALTIIAREGKETRKIVIARGLKAGSDARVKIPGDICLADIHGVYSDKSSVDAADLDLCRRHTLRLIEGL